jgi:mannonate dehydratase
MRWPVRQTRDGGSGAARSPTPLKEASDRTMRITDVRCILTAPAGVGLAVVKVETSEAGLYGVGCATFTQRLLAVRSVVEDYLKPLLVGRDPQCIEDIWQLAYQNAYWRNGPIGNNAISGVDEALWDIKGKVAGLPLYQLLGGKVRDGAVAYRHAQGRDAEEVLDDVLRLRAEGFTHVRCQLGDSGPYGRTVAPRPGLGSQPGRTIDPVAYAAGVPALFELLRDRLGPEMMLLHDVHERLAPIDAVRLARALEPYQLFFLEDPLAPEDQGWFRILRQQTVTPVAVGELFTHPLEWRTLIVEHLIDFIRVHLSDIGGITPARKVAALAEAFGVRTAFHGPGDVSPIGHAANVHLAVCLPNFGIQEFWGFQDVLTEVFPGCPEVREGNLYPADRPGLGIDIDEALAARFPIHPDMYQFRDGVVDWTQTRLPDGTLVRP